MNSKPHQSSDLSQSDADLFAHLTDLAETIEPDPAFKVALEAQFRQTHSANSPQTAQGTNPMNFVLPRLNRHRRAALVSCASLATAAALIMPTLFNPVADSNANAQALAQAFATGQVTIMADTQEANETTQEVTATGNAVFNYPAAQLQAKAHQITIIPNSGQLTLSGNVEISQRGENLRGSQARCSFVEKQCSLTKK
jgi:lipopolysaccharide export system protein LptA